MLAYQLKYLGKGDMMTLQTAKKSMFYSLDQSEDLKIGYFEQNGREVSFSKSIHTRAYLTGGQLNCQIQIV
jgi:hypothetical protein